VAGSMLLGAASGCGVVDASGAAPPGVGRTLIQPETVASLRPVVQAGRLGAGRCLPCGSSAALGDEARHGGPDS
jgi:hypothetical protein